MLYYWSMITFLIRLVKNNLFIALLLSIIYFSIILPINESIAFSDPKTQEELGFSYLVKTLFFLALFVIFFILLSIVQNRNNLSQFTKYWIKISAFSIVILTISLLLLYPGHWVWDEFNILETVKHFYPDSWQNIFTNIFYSFSLFLFPSGISIVVLQLLIISVVIGYVTSLVRKYVKSKWLPFLLFVVFLSPVMLIHNLYPLRLTLYGYLELALIATIVETYLNKDFRKNLFAFCLSMFLLMIMIFWRTEGIFYLLIIPIVMYRFNIFNKSNLNNNGVIISLVLSFGIFISGFLITKAYSSSRYTLTAIINPLSIMLQSPLSGKSTIADIHKLNEVLDLKQVKNEASYLEVPSYWNGAVRPDYEQHLSGFYFAYLRIVTNNLPVFLEARLQTFLATNALDNTTPTPISPLAYKKQWTNANQKTVDKFYQNNMLSKPLNPDVKLSITRALLMLNDQNRVNKLGKIVWSIIPTVIILLILSFVFIAKRLWVLLAVNVIIFARVILIFISAPAGYFMYFIPTYLCGGVMILLAIFHLFKPYSEKTLNKLKRL